MFSGLFILQGCGFDFHLDSFYFYFKKVGKIKLQLLAMCFLTANTFSVSTCHQTGNILRILSRHLWPDYIVKMELTIISVLSCSPTVRFFLNILRNLAGYFRYYQLNNRHISIDMVVFIIAYHAHQ